MSGGRSFSGEELRVAAALRMEARALRRGVHGLPIERTGVGPERARLAAGRLAASPARALAVAGLCGGLHPDLEPGDVLVASELRDESGEPRAVESAGLCAALRGLGLRVRRGALLSVDRVVRGAERAELAAGGALAVDMESFWLAPAARGRPFAVLRVVSDGPNHELFRPAALGRLRRALGVLSVAAPALVWWAAGVAPAPRPLAWVETLHLD